MDPDAAGALLAAVPEEARRKAPRCFATLGAGNHFLELQRIVEIVDRPLAEALGLETGQAFFMIHTGSRAVGNKTMKAILAESEAIQNESGAIQTDRGAIETKSGAIDASGGASALATIHAGSDAGRRAALAIQAAASFGFANRTALHHRLREAARAALGRPALELPLLYDCAHVSIKREEWNGESLWVHRHGASRALPAARLASHSAFARTGQPVPVPGSMGDDSYVCVALDGASAAFHSVNHGCGRRLDKPEAAARFTATQIEDEWRGKRIRLYRYGRGDIAEQAPGAFKSAREVVAAMQAMDLARPVARLRPVAVLKG
jgi:tRNA-splicing ligase RtcB